MLFRHGAIITFYFSSLCQFRVTFMKGFRFPSGEKTWKQHKHHSTCDQSQTTPSISTRMWESSRDFPDVCQMLRKLCRNRKPALFWIRGARELCASARSRVSMVAQHGSNTQGIRKHLTHLLPISTPISKLNLPLLVPAKNNLEVPHT